MLRSDWWIGWQCCLAGHQCFPGPGPDLDSSLRLSKRANPQVTKIEVDLDQSWGFSDTLLDLAIPKLAPWTCSFKYCWGKEKNHKVTRIQVALKRKRSLSYHLFEFVSLNFNHWSIIDLLHMFCKVYADLSFDEKGLFFFGRSTFVNFYRKI